MNIKTISMCLSLLFLVGGCYAQQDLKSDEKDNALLDQILQQEFKGGAYTVVDPMMYISKLNKDSREYVKQGIKIEGYAIGPLCDQLIQKNKKQAWLTLKSSSDREEFQDWKNGSNDLCVMC